MGPTWGPPGADRAQVGPMLAPWTSLSGIMPFPAVSSRAWKIERYSPIENHSKICHSFAVTTMGIEVTTDLEITTVESSTSEVCTWWRHQMETFSVLLALYAGNSPVTGEFPAQRPVTRSFDIFFDLQLNERLSKQSWGWWFEAPSYSLCRHCNENSYICSGLQHHRIG